MNALHFAAQHGNFSKIEVLLAAGMSKATKDKKNRTAFDIAKENKHLDAKLLQLLNPQVLTASGINDTAAAPKNSP